MPSVSLYVPGIFASIKLMEFHAEEVSLYVPDIFASI